MKSSFIAFAMMSAISAFALTGIILDGVGAPVDVANVKLIVDGRTTLTNEKGEFAFNAVTQSTLISDSDTKIEFRNGGLHFYSAGNAKLDLYVANMSGAVIRSVRDATISPGNHYMNVWGEIEPTAGLYVIKYSIGNTKGQFLALVSSKSFQEGVKIDLRNKILRKEGSSVVDTLEISKNGYNVLKKPIYSYEENVGKLYLVSSVFGSSSSTKISSSSISVSSSLRISSSSLSISSSSSSKVSSSSNLLNCLSNDANLKMYLNTNISHASTGSPFPKDITTDFCSVGMMYPNTDEYYAQNYRYQETQYKQYLNGVWSEWKNLEPYELIGIGSFTKIGRCLLDPSNQFSVPDIGTKTIFRARIIGVSGRCGDWVASSDTLAYMGRMQANTSLKSSQEYINSKLLINIAEPVLESGANRYFHFQEIHPTYSSSIQVASKNPIMPLTTESLNDKSFKVAVQRIDSTGKYAPSKWDTIETPILKYVKIKSLSTQVTSATCLSGNRVAYSLKVTATIYGANHISAIKENYSNLNYSKTSTNSDGTSIWEFVPPTFSVDHSTKDQYTYLFKTSVAANEMLDPGYSSWTSVEHSVPLIRSNWCK